MTYRGHVKNGQIMLDEPAQLPESVPVKVEVLGEGVRISRPQRREKLQKFEALRMPGGSLADELVNNRR